MRAWLRWKKRRAGFGSIRHTYSGGVWFSALWFGGVYEMHRRHLHLLLIDRHEQAIEQMMRDYVARLWP